MKYSSDKAFAEIEETAIEGTKAVREFLTYQGTNEIYEAKARVGGAAVSSYSRLAGTRTNEEGLRQKAAKKRKV